jgi:lipoprotein-anchoring transpeptidase ErfK/SrfK
MPEGGVIGWAVRALAAALVLIFIGRIGSDRPADLLTAAQAQSRSQASARVPVDPQTRLRLARLAPMPVRSMLNVRERMRYGQLVWNDANVPAGPVWVHIDRRAQIISVFRAGHEIGTAVILYGAPEKPTPSGRYPVLGKTVLHRSRAYGAPMPYSVWLTRDGVAIHASDVREGAATHGCIGVPRDFARRLFDVVRKGDPVVIA